MGHINFLPVNAPYKEMMWALIDFVAWCLESEGNLASTISGKLAVAKYLRRMEARVEIIALTPLIKCALRSIARFHIAAGTARRVDVPFTCSILRGNENIVLV